MKIVICEDELHWAVEIKNAASRWAINRQIEMQCKCFSTPLDLIEHINKFDDVDIILLDISLGNEAMDGMAAAKYIRKIGNHIPIIFVTIDSLRASDGYLVEAMGFLCKPIDEIRLSLYLDRILAKKKDERTISLKSDSNIINIMQNDIVYVEIKDHTITYFTTKEEISHRGTIADIIERLGSENFIQIHRSFVIAKSKIQKIKSTYPYSVGMIKGKETINLSVSRSYIDKLLAVYSDDLLERLI